MILLLQNSNELLDTYQLKSLHGVLEASIREVSIVKDKKGKLMLKMAEVSEDEQKMTLITLLYGSRMTESSVALTFDTDSFYEYVEKSHFLLIWTK